MIDPKHKQALAEACDQIDGALNDPEIGNDVAYMTLALCRLDRDARAKLLRYAHELITDRIVDQQVIDQHVRRERMRGSVS